MSNRCALFHVSSPDETDALAVRLGTVLQPGDCVLLSGALGAGKSHFSRALIAARLPIPEDVPSPTFTLVQIYDLDDCELWHCDLYRLSDPDQIVELGLLEAFETAICLIEWPDRLGPLAPPDALDITLRDGPGDSAREIAFRWTDPKWETRLGTIHANG